MKPVSDADVRAVDAFAMFGLELAAAVLSTASVDAKLDTTTLAAVNVASLAAAAAAFVDTVVCKAVMSETGSTEVMPVTAIADVSAVPKSVLAARSVEREVAALLLAARAVDCVASVAV